MTDRTLVEAPVHIPFLEKASKGKTGGENEYQ